MRRFGAISRSRMVAMNSGGRGRLATTQPAFPAAEVMALKRPAWGLAPKCRFRSIQHDAPRLRLRPGQRRPRHTGAAGLARPQEHPAHGPLHRAVAASVQGLLALIDRLSSHRSDPQEVMVWAVPSLCGLLLSRAPPCAGARTRAPSKRRARIVASPNARDF